MKKKSFSISSILPTLAVFELISIIWKIIALFYLMSLLKVTHPELVKLTLIYCLINSFPSEVRVINQK